MVMFALAIAGGVLPPGAQAEHPPTAFMFTERVANTSLRMPQSGPASVTDFPQTLADTGAFASLATLTPQPGIIPFELNVPLWSDGAHKTRWFCLPGTNRIVFSRDGGWVAPIGTVWIKHFDLELTNGVAESARRLETRFLVRTEDGVYGVTYRWGGSLTNAMLVDAGGLNEDFGIHDGGTVRKQTWHYPAHSECLACHSQAAGYSLGFNSAQFNREVRCPDGPQNQIRRLNELGCFNTNISGLNTLRALAHPTNTAVSLEYRVRSYLAANCVHCHQPEAFCPTPWNGVLTNSLAGTHLINGELGNNWGDSENRVIKSGDPDHSVLLKRLSRRGAFQMPPLCTTVVDTEGVALFAAWITNDLPRRQSFGDWQLAHFGPTSTAEAAPEADPDGDGACNYLEYLTGTDPQRGGDAWRISIRKSSEGMQIWFPQTANRGFEVQWTTNLADPSSWQALDVPGNRPFFSGVDREFGVADSGFNPLDERAPRRFYRGRVFEP
jgi:mono/diheme cytochrome c family protein